MADIYKITFSMPSISKKKIARRGGIVVVRRTQEREVGGLILTQVAVLCP